MEKMNDIIIYLCRFLGGGDPRLQGAETRFTTLGLRSGRKGGADFLRSGGGGALLRGRSVRVCVV